MEEKHTLSKSKAQHKIVPVTPKKSPATLKGFGELLTDSWNIFTRMWKRLLGLYVVLYLSIFAVGFLFAMLVGLGLFVVILFNITGFLPMALLFIGMLFFIVFIAATAILTSVILIRAIKDREHPISIIQSIKEAKKDIVPYYVVSMLTGVVVTIGYTLFIILGIIFSVWFMFATYEYIYQDKRGFAALQTSKAYAKGRWWNIFLLGVLPGLFIFVASFVLQLIANLGSESAVIGGITIMLRFILNIIATPLYLIYFVLLYENIKSTYMGGDVVLTKKQRNKYIAGIVLGSVMMIVLLGIAAYGMILVASKIPEIEQKFQFDPYGRDHYGEPPIPDSSGPYMPDTPPDY